MRAVRAVRAVEEIQDEYTRRLIDAREEQRGKPNIGTLAEAITELCNLSREAGAQGAELIDMTGGAARMQKALMEEPTNDVPPAWPRWLGCKKKRG